MNSAPHRYGAERTAGFDPAPSRHACAGGALRAPPWVSFYLIVEIRPDAPERQHPITETVGADQLIGQPLAAQISSGDRSGRFSPENTARFHSEARKPFTVLPKAAPLISQTDGTEGRLNSRFFDRNCADWHIPQLSGGEYCTALRWGMYHGWQVGNIVRLAGREYCTAPK